MKNALGYQEVSFWRGLSKLPALLKNPIPVLNGFFKAHGDTYAMKRGKTLFLFTRNPAMIRHVLQKNHRNYRKSEQQTGQLARFIGNGLLTSSGAYWKKQRRLIQPSFNREKIRALEKLMEQEAETFITNLTVDHGPLDLHREMMTLTFGIVAKSLFSTSISTEKLTELREHVEAGERLVIKLLRAPILEPWLKLTGVFRRTQTKLARADNIIFDIINQRKQLKQEHPDLLNQLLQARYEDTGEAMSNQQLLDESKIMFVAGHETSANALTWSLYLLTKHPELLHRARMEIHAESTYLRQVLQETMRLYPPAWLSDREALNDDNFDGKPIPKGAIVMTYFYGANHNHLYWKNPTDFDPDRFAHETHQDTFFPFGAGPRMCIGNHFALMEMEIILKKLITHFDFELVEKGPAKLHPLITLNPKNGMKMVLKSLK